MNMIDRLEKIIELAKEYCFTNVFFANAKGVECKFTRNNENLSPEEFYDYAWEMIGAVEDDEMDIDEYQLTARRTLENPASKETIFCKKIETASELRIKIAFILHFIQ